MSGAQEPVGTVDVALQHAVKLLGESPALAAEQAEEILKAAPQHPLALLIKGVSRRNLGDPKAALEVLRPLAAAQPGWAPAHYELGVTLGHAGFGDEAVAALTRAVQLKTDIGDAWRLLADHYTAMGDTSAADAAYANHIKVSTRDPRLLAPAAALVENRIAVAEALLRDHLKKSPTDVAAIRMLAEVAARLGRLVDSENLLARCLELAPGFNAARHNYAVVLHRRNKETESLAEVERLLAVEPHNAGLRSLKAAILARLGSVDQAIDIYAGVLADYPRQAKVWMSYGHSLKTAGRQAECIDAYRKSIELSPGLGEAYWSLANLKTFRFSQPQVETMTAQLRRADLSNEDRLHFHFALGKAFEDAKRVCRVLRTLRDGQSAPSGGPALRRRRHDEPRPAQQGPIHRRSFLRSGPTRAHRRRIRFSWSACRGPVRRSSSRSWRATPPWKARWNCRTSSASPWNSADAGKSRMRRSTRKYSTSLGADELRALGDRYLRQTRIQRKTDAPFFIDKLPNNWAHVGLIQLILPNARIIDARRHPLSCCFSAFKQHFARGQAFTYGLEDIGRYYRDYVDLMAHFDRVLPGRVHRVIYERMVDDTDAEVRRLLEYCGLPFEEACLRFYENDRAVRTASSEQVRRPIYRESVDQWRNYDTWLQPLRDALGPVLDAYPGVPTLSNS